MIYKTFSLALIFALALGSNQYTLALINSFDYKNKINLDQVKRCIADAVQHSALDKYDEYGLTALHNVVGGFVYDKPKQKELCFLLLDNGSNVNARTRDSFSTPLISASGWASAEIVELLLKRGANPYLKEKDEYTALDNASNPETKTILKMYMNEGWNMLNVNPGKYLIPALGSGTGGSKVMRNKISEFLPLIKAKRKD